MCKAKTTIQTFVCRYYANKPSIYGSVIAKVRRLQRTHRGLYGSIGITDHGDLEVKLMSNAMCGGRAFGVIGKRPRCQTDSVRAYMFAIGCDAYREA